MKKTKTHKLFTNTLLLFGSILFSFLVAELLVRLFLPQDKKVTWIEMHPNGFMMNQSSGSAIHEFGNRNTTYHFTEYRTRGTLPPDSSKTRVLTLGDSFTFGLYLNDGDTYVDLLQQKSDILNPESIQFINAAVGGAGLADWPGWLENYGNAIQPDILIFFLNTNDIERSLSKNLFVYDNQSDSVTTSRRWVARPYFAKLGMKNWYRWLQQHSEVMNILVKLLWKFMYFEDVTESFNQNKTKVPIPSPEQLDPQSDYSLILSQRIIQRMNNWCIDNECEFILTTTGFFSESKPDDYTAGFYEWLITSDSLSYPFYDITDCMLETTGDNLQSIQIPGDSHPNEKGARLIADCSWNWLETELKEY